MQRKFKELEYQIYKDIHRRVLEDDGFPTLKKTGFSMPGYRKIIGDRMNQYEIDNTVVKRTQNREDHLEQQIIPDYPESESSLNQSEQVRSAQLSEYDLFEQLAKQKS